MHNNLRTNPEFTTLIPPLSAEEYSQLEQNILSQGCRDPIALWRGIIVDGHNRYEICTKHGLPYETVKLRFASKDAAKLWVLENQLGRRNLTDAMRIELAMRKVELTGQKTYIRKYIAQESGIDEKKIRRYMQIKAKGDRELIEKVLSGDMKIGTAHRHVEVITTTRESMGTVTLSPEMELFVINRAVVSHIRQLENLYALLLRHCEFCKKAPWNLRILIINH